jgi:excisionase family DNA binding protein
MGVDERWVGVDEVATHLHVAKDSVYRWIESRGLPAHRVGRLLRFKLSDVDAWVQAGGGRAGSRIELSRSPARRSRKAGRTR